MNEKKQPSVHYPRAAAKSQLGTALSYQQEITALEQKLNTTENPNEADKMRYQLLMLHEKVDDLQRKNFEYNCGYSFLFDGIAVLCTDFNDQIPRPVNNYYVVNVTPEGLETICLGNYKSAPDIKNKFWNDFYNILREPKTLTMATEEGLYTGEPIRILIKHKDGTTSRQISNLKNVGGKTVEFIQLEFFAPMFRAVVEYAKNWIPLPRHLQAVLYHVKKTSPELFAFTYKSIYDEEKEINLSIATVRKYFLYVSNHNNNIGDKMNIDAVRFFQQVKPDQICRGDELKNWYLSKQVMDALCRLHNELTNKGLLDGISFNTCAVYYDKTTKNFTVFVKRHRPLAVEYQQEISYTPGEEDIPY